MSEETTRSKGPIFSHHSRGGVVAFLAGAAGRPYWTFDMGGYRPMDPLRPRRAALVARPQEPGTKPGPDQTCPGPQQEGKRSCTDLSLHRLMSLGTTHWPCMS